MLFCDYPEKCKEKIESFEWSTTLPEPAQKISGKWPLFNNLPMGKVAENMPLHELFNINATVSDLLKEFGWHSLEVSADKTKNESDESSEPGPSPLGPWDFHRPLGPRIPFRGASRWLPFYGQGALPPYFYQPQNY